MYFTTASWGPLEKKKSWGPGHVPSVPIGQDGPDDGGGSGGVARRHNAAMRRAVFSAAMIQRRLYRH